MLLIIICGAVAVLFSIIGFILNRTYDGTPFLFIACLFATIFVCELASLINIERGFQTTINKYEITKVLIENYTPNDYGNQSDLLKQVIDVNNAIAKHKSHAGNIWTGVWYSEEIGSLEPLFFKRPSEEPPIKE